MSQYTDYGAPESAQPPTAVTGARSSVALPPSTGGLVPTSCTHERASGRLRLAEGFLVREMVCDNDACGAVLHAFPPLTYRTPSMTSSMPAKSLTA